MAETPKLKEETKPSDPYILVDAAIPEHLESFRAKVAKASEIAVDCEWHVNKLCLVQIAVPDCAFLFHVTALGSDFVTQATKQVLEAKSPEKLMFDCREDAKYLHAELGIHLNGVYDIQLLEIVTRDEPHRENRLFWNLRGLGRLLRDLGMAEESRVKDTFTSSVIFTEKILSPMTLQYAATDVLSLFKVRDQLHKRPKYSALLDEEVRQGSEKYASVWHFHIPDKYMRHAMLLHGILPRLTPQRGHKTCQGCRRPVAKKAFCPVCHIIQLRSQRDEEEDAFYNGSWSD